VVARTLALLLLALTALGCGAEGRISPGPSAPRPRERAVGHSGEGTPAAGVEERCARADERIDLTALGPLLADRILAAAGVPDGGMENPGFVRRWVRCDELARITELALGEVESLAGLPPLPALESLAVVDVVDGDLSPLRALPRLRRLTLGPPLHAFTVGRRFRIESFEPIGDLGELEELHLVNGAITDVAFVRRLGRLRVLDLRENQIRDLSPLAGLTLLTSLHLGGNAVDDISPLAGLRDLRYLDVSSNAVATLDPLANAPMLEELDASDTRVSDLVALHAMPRLRSAYLCGAPITEDPALNGPAQRELKRFERRGVRVMINFRGCHCC
jgi:Leucine-rich repeat (LRR) protein